MASSPLKRPSIEDRDNGSSRKKSKSSTGPSYVSIRAWTVLNYEVKRGEEAVVKDLVLHALEDQYENLSFQVLHKAIARAFGGQVKSKRVCRNNQRLHVYQNLRRKPVVIEKLHEDLCGEWKNFFDHSEELPRIKTRWIVIKETKFSVSFVHVTNVRFNGQRALWEIRFCFNTEDESTGMYVKYHNRTLNLDELKVIGSLETSGSKAKFMMQFLDYSDPCHGFDINDSDELHNVPITRHTIVHGIDGVEKVRGFSPQCQVLANYLGERCNNCCMARKSLQKKSVRKNRKDGPAPCTNHRYMSKDEIIKKLEKERKEMRKLLYKREKMQVDEEEVDEDNEEEEHEEEEDEEDEEEDDEEEDGEEDEEEEEEEEDEDSEDEKSEDTDTSGCVHYQIRTLGSLKVKIKPTSRKLPSPR